MQSNLRCPAICRRGYNRRRPVTTKYTIEAKLNYPVTCSSHSKIDSQTIHTATCQLTAKFRVQWKRNIFLCRHHISRERKRTDMGESKRVVKALNDLKMIFTTHSIYKYDIKTRTNSKSIKLLHNHAYLHILKKIIKINQHNISTRNSMRLAPVL